MGRGFKEEGGEVGASHLGHPAGEVLDVTVVRMGLFVPVCVCVCVCVCLCVCVCVRVHAFFFFGALGCLQGVEHESL